MEINLMHTDVKTVIRIMLAETGSRGVSELARQRGESESTLRSSINRGALRVEDLKWIASQLGYSVIVRKD